MINLIKIPATVAIVASFILANSERSPWAWGFFLFVGVLLAVQKDE